MRAGGHSARPLVLDQAAIPRRSKHGLSVFLTPDDPEFNQVAKSEALPAVFEGDLVGRVLTLDVTQTKRFQCGGFAVSFNNPIGIVTSMAFQPRLREALFDQVSRSGPKQNQITRVWAKLRQIGRESERRSQRLVSKGGVGVTKIFLVCRKNPS